MSRGTEYLMVVLSIGVAAWLELVMVEAELLGVFSVWLQPQLVALVVIYWCLHWPHKFGVLVAWSIGLWMDGVNGSVLGQQAAAMAVQAYCTFMIYVRVRLFPRWQQSLVVMVLVGINLLVNRTLQGLVTGVTESIFYYAPMVSSALLWFAVVWLLDHCRVFSLRVG